MKVLHVLDHSLPYFSGYSFRSEYLLRAQKRLGIEPVVITSPKHEDFEDDFEIIRGIVFHRVRWPSIPASGKLQTAPMVRQMACIAALSREVANLADKLRVDLIHAHSPSLNGLAAARAADQLGLPWVYEVRYFDEDAAVDRGKIRHNSLRYRLSQRMEQAVLEQAVRIVTINRSLRDEVARREIPGGKINIIPNGVDSRYFHPVEPDRRLMTRLGLTGSLVIGFIGSLNFHEGIEYLIEAAEILLERGVRLKAVVVGEGEAEEGLRALIPHRWRGNFIFTGKISHGEIQGFYSVMDVVVYPRLRSRLTELTTPLKPLEAMAMSRIVVASDLRAMRELVREGETGFLVEPENARALADRIEWLLAHPDFARETSRRARRFAVMERDWDRLAHSYKSIYEDIQNVL